MLDERVGLKKQYEERQQAREKAGGGRGGCVQCAELQRELMYYRQRQGEGAHSSGDGHSSSAMNANNQLSNSSMGRPPRNASMMQSSHQAPAGSAPTHVKVELQVGCQMLPGADAVAVLFEKDAYSGRYSFFDQTEYVTCVAPRSFLSLSLFFLSLFLLVFCC